MRKQRYAVSRTNHEKMVEINQYKAKDLLWPSAIRKFFATIGIEVPIPFTTLFVFVPAFDRYILPAYMLNKFKYMPVPVKQKILKNQLTGEALQM